MMAGRGLMKQFAGIFVVAAVLLAVPAFATMSPATWVSHRLIGVKDGNWVAMRTERHYASYYEYRTKSEMHLVQIATGCRSRTIVLQETQTLDEDTHGNWMVTVVGGTSLPSGIIDGMIPVLPSGWQNWIKITSGAVAMRDNDTDVVIVPATMLAKWAALQGIAEFDELQISEMFGSTDAGRSDGMMFLELESKDVDSVDVDYARFIVPLAAYKLAKMSENTAITAEMIAQAQPQPSGC